MCCKYKLSMVNGNKGCHHDTHDPRVQKGCLVFETFLTQELFADEATEP